MSIINEGKAYPHKYDENCCNYNEDSDIIMMTKYYYNCGTRNEQQQILRAGKHRDAHT